MSPPARRRPDPGSPPLAQRLFRAPLLHKIVAANALVVTAGAVAGTTISVYAGRSWTGGSTPWLAAGFAAAGLLLSVAVNVLLLRWLLTPLARLEEAAARIQEGGEPVEEAIPLPERTDPGLERLVEAFNGMLGSLARYRSRLRALAGRSLEAREEERLRLSRTLQEDTAQRVASCLVRLGSARRMVGGERDRALDGLRDDLGETLEEIRRLARALRPPELGDIGLESALRALARETGERGGPHVRIEIADTWQPLPPEARLTLYRAVESTIRVCRDRGDTDRVGLAIESTSREVVAELRAEAGTLSVSTSPESGVGGLELFAVRERARLAGGEVTVESGPSGGVERIRITLPAATPGSAGGDDEPAPSAHVRDDISSTAER